MTLTREVMTPDPRCIGVNDALSIAAEIMAEHDIGCLPICGEDRKLKGMLTDRDIVIKAVALGLDPNTTAAGQFAEGRPVTVSADDDVTVAIQRMQEHQLRRIPVIEDRRLVGILSQGDIARTLSSDKAGALVARISQ